MRRSDSTYEDLDPEDPVADLAKLVREEYRNYLLGTGDEGGNGASSRLGGLDTLVADLLESPVIQQAITNLVVQVLQSPHFKQACQVLLSELWTDLVNDPETLQQVIHLLQHAIQDDKIKDAAVELVIEVFSDKEILDELVELVQRLGEEKKVNFVSSTKNKVYCVVIGEGGREMALFINNMMNSTNPCLLYFETRGIQIEPLYRRHHQTSLLLFLKYCFILLIFLNRSKMRHGPYW